MPTFNVRAIDWSLDTDLDGTLQASTYRVQYREIGASHNWSPTYFNDIKPFRGEAAPDLVEIEATTDGYSETVLTGVVDRSGWNDRDGGDVIGDLTGRDYLALVLDRNPLEPTTLQGTRILADGTLSYTDVETFTSSMAALASQAGLTVLFDGVTDYKLGKSLPITPDRTFGETMEELLRPLRWSERHRVDCWVEGTILRVAKRNYTNPPRGTVTVDKARLITDRMEKSPTQLVSDVRIDGMTYEVAELDIQTPPPPGGPSGAAYHVNYGPTTNTQTISGVTETWVDEGTDWYNAAGQLTYSFRKVSFLSKVRYETWEKTYTYWADSTKPYNGAKKTEDENHFVSDQVGSRNIQENVHVKKSSWTYYEDTGDTKSADTLTIEKDERGTNATTPLSTRSHIVERHTYRRSAGYVYLHKEITDIDATSGASTSFSTSQVGALKIPSLDQSVTPPGKRMVERQVSAGPEEVSGGGRLRRERSELLGDEDSCEAIRADLVDEHTQVKLSATFRMAPDLRVKPGKLLIVQNAPTFWPATQFYITSVRKEAGDDGMAQTVEALTWVAA